MCHIEELKRKLKSILESEQGVTTVEYAVMLVLIAIAVATFGSGLSGAVTNVFSRLVSVLASAS